MATGGGGCLRPSYSLQRATYTTGLSHQRVVELGFLELCLKMSSEMHVQGVFLHWASPKKLKYGKPRLGVSRTIYVNVD